MRGFVQVLLAGLKFGTKDYVLLATLAAVNIPSHIFLAKLMFDGWEGFKEAVCFLFTPDIFSIFTNEYIDDRWAEAKLGLFFFLCIAQWVGGLVLITKIFY
jgi:hypothetical protein